MAITYGVKALGIFSTIFGLLALITCCWTFGSMIVYHNHLQMGRANGSVHMVSENDYHARSPAFPKLWAKLENFSRRFKIMMYVCIWISNVFILGQIIASLFIIARKNTKIWSVSKYFVGVHFIVFLALLSCLFVPLSQDRKRNIQHSITTFNDYIMIEFDSLATKGLDYIVQDFNAYYFALGSNIVIIFMCMIIACCLFRCETHRPYESV